MSDVVRIRAAEAVDVEAMLRVERECVEAPQWGEAVWRGLIVENGLGLRCVMVAEDTHGVVGFVVTGGVAGIAELESVAVKVAARRKGAGRALCLEAMRRAADGGAVAMELEVREASVAARRIYAGLGFIEQGMRRGYYQEPTDDAVLMVAVLTGR